MNILLINLYSTPDKFKKRKDNFKDFFKDKVKLIIKNWTNKKGIISLIKKNKIDGIILSGSDFRIKKTNKGIIPKEVFLSNIPILGICYGFQYLVYYYSSLKNIKSFKIKNYNKYDKSLIINKPFKIKKTKYRFNHHDYIIKLPKNWKISIKNKNIIYMGFDDKNIGIQFHPEIYKKSSNLFYSMWLKYISIRKYIS
jgi:GMP synthase-like glutamine amidotransferase